MPKIVGQTWELSITDGRGGWEFDGWPSQIRKMVNDEFPPERIVEQYDEKHIITWGTRFGPLYDDVLEFLAKWGVEARGVDLPKMEGENGPRD